MAFNLRDINEGFFSKLIGTYYFHSFNNYSVGEDVCFQIFTGDPKGYSLFYLVDGDLFCDEGGYRVNVNKQNNEEKKNNKSE